MRVVDYAFALTILLGFWWVLLAAWIAIRRDSPGPGIFGQPRIGRYGKVFTCWKFRTMQVGTTQAGTHEVSAAAVTKVGAFLRRTKIDELPQVWNILRGEIALIGPRPCLPVQTQLIEARQQRGVLDVLPGISGLAQVEGIDMSDPLRLARRDADYVALRGVLPDIRLILRTARGGGQGDRVRAGKEKC
jgi:lipopolysaccharide/colanic/teichoic acid biosynthesis glycosyltransferase